MSIKNLLNDYNIPYTISGKNTKRGWINIKCPVCDDISNHGGINLQNNYYHCWKCGHHKLEYVIAKILSISKSEALELIEKYSNTIKINDTTKKEKINNKKCIFPKTIPLIDKHKKYLLSRNYDPDKIETLWDIKSTTNIGDYKNRIFIPIYFNKRIVSFTTRSISNNDAVRYKSCKLENEEIHHKNILYGLDYVKNRKAILVEGAFDTWRVGYGAIATFGTSYTKEQLKLLIKEIDILFILFDKDAFKIAKKLYTDLYTLMLHVEIIKLAESIKDPGELLDKDGEYLRKYFLNY
jgi:DNA primase